VSLASLEELKRIQSAEMPEPMAWYDFDLDIHFGKTHPEFTGEGWKPLYGHEILAVIHRNDAEADEDWREAMAEISNKARDIEKLERERDALIAEVEGLRKKLDEVADVMRENGIETPGWIEHTGPDGSLVRDNLTIAATLMFWFDAVRENKITPFTEPKTAAIDNAMSEGSK